MAETGYDSQLRHGDSKAAMESCLQMESSHFHNTDDEKEPPATVEFITKTPEQHDTKRSFRDTSRKERVIFALLFLRELTAYTASGLMPPLFPAEVGLTTKHTRACQNQSGIEPMPIALARYWSDSDTVALAESHNVSTTVTGWIFGIFPLIQFAASPLAGRLIPVVGAKYMLVGGSLLYGAATVSFGCLTFLPARKDPMVYIVLCFAVRIGMALGNAVAVTAVYAISTYTFSSNPATALGILELAVGLGMMAGPLIAGALYQVGRFDLPFIVVGVVIIVLVPAYFAVINVDSLPTREKKRGPETSVVTLLRVPSITLISLAVMLSAALWGALDPTLEPHLEQYELSVFKVSLVFLLMAGTYALSSPAVGFAADKLSDSNPPIIMGFILMSIFFLILGPSPILGRGSVLWLDLIALTVIALGLSLSSVPNIAKMISSAEKSGIGNSMALHGAVAGLYNGVYALGDAVGPVMGSLATDLHGFPLSMTYCATTSLFMATMLCILWICEHRTLSRKLLCCLCSSSNL